MEISFGSYLVNTVLGRDLEMIDDYIDYNLVYEYKLNGIYYHDHDFMWLLKELTYRCLNEEKWELDFSEFDEQYSKQELELIERYLIFLAKSIKDFDTDNIKIVK